MRQTLVAQLSERHNRFERVMVCRQLLAITPPYPQDVAPGCCLLCGDPCADDDNAYSHWSGSIHVECFKAAKEGGFIQGDGHCQLCIECKRVVSLPEMRSLTYLAVEHPAWSYFVACAPCVRAGAAPLGTA